MYKPRVLTPSEGCWLCSRAQHITSQLVYLGIHADLSDWEEITAEERDRLEAQWQKEQKMELETALATDELTAEEALRIITGGEANA